ncbi:MAG: hypothetical protein AB7N80_14305 [Bdellovibrionales bacterium]
MKTVAGRSCDFYKQQLHDQVKIGQAVAYFSTYAREAYQVCMSEEDRKPFFAQLGRREVVALRNSLNKKCNFKSENRMDCLDRVNKHMQAVIVLNGRTRGENEHDQKKEGEIREAPIPVAWEPNAEDVYQSCTFAGKIYTFNPSKHGNPPAFCEDEPSPPKKLKHIRLQQQRTTVPVKSEFVQ